MNESKNGVNTREYQFKNYCGFFVNVAIIGEISSGKSTLLNAIFGDILAETSIDRSTKTVYEFYESNVTNNKDVWRSTRETNLNQEQLFVKYDASKFSLKPKLNHFPSFGVTESQLIPKLSKYNNSFCVMDFPGFNDPTFDDQIFNIFSQDCHKFDFVFYVVDSKICLKTHSSQKLFQKVITIIQNALSDTKCNTILVLLFNKYDEVSVKLKSEQFVTEQEKKMVNLISKAGIPDKNVRCFHISAIQLLIRRVIKSQDYNYCLRHKIMDQVYEFCTEFWGKQQIRQLHSKGIKEQIEIIHKKTIQYEQKYKNSNINISNQNDEKCELLKENEQEIIGVMADYTGEFDSKFLSFLDSLRDSVILSKKAIQYLNNLKLNNALKLKRFFDSVYCLCVSNNNAKMDYLPGFQLIIFEKLLTISYNLIEQCLIQLIDVLPVLHVNGDDKGASDCITNLIQLISEYTTKKYLTSKILRKFESKINLDIKETHNYYLFIGRAFVSTIMTKCKNKQQDFINLDELIKFISQFYKYDDPTKPKYLKALLLEYPFVGLIKVGKYCRVIELSQYYFDITTLRKEFTYEEYAVLCMSQVSGSDTTFKTLIKELSISLSPPKLNE